MPRDAERIERIQGELRATRLDALVCALPSNVLLATGYWPVVGTSIAVVTREGFVGLALPEDEIELARGREVDAMESFSVPLDSLSPTAEHVAAALERVARKSGVERGAIGFEEGPHSNPSSYAEVHLFAGSIRDLVAQAWPRSALSPAGRSIRRLASVMTRAEIDRLRRACRIAAHAFEEGVRGLAVGRTEAAVAAGFQAPLFAWPFEEGLGVARAGGFAACISGKRSAAAFGSHARSGARRLERGDFALVHMNSYADGYFTDITRTYVLGSCSKAQAAIFAAIVEARARALEAIRPGAKAADVDDAVRRAFSSRGVAHHFKHATGHGVGFTGINHQAPPRLRPRSPDVLETGMVFNVEPALYLPDIGGARWCDMILLDRSGPEILTPFQSSPTEWSIVP